MNYVKNTPKREMCKMHIFRTDRLLSNVWRCSSWGWHYIGNSPSVVFQHYSPYLFNSRKLRDRFTWAVFTCPSVYQKHHECNHSIHSLHYVGRKDAIPNSFLELIKSSHSPWEPSGTGQLSRKVAIQRLFFVVRWQSPFWGKLLWIKCHKIKLNTPG